ncbi:glycosyltransferase family 4 protein [Botryobacter ruber]|uniref:glycosyltransferase family 4 protein n=1 Tax=Botryobacter ruber TaxID=2171629 RepID=UPI000E09EA47|nr:glycosyltransferase family 4 protein [Botryobacter ruber]
MKILYLMPSWGQPSELWALRMLEMLQDHVVLVCTRDKDLKTCWNDIPVLGLQQSPSVSEKIKFKLKIQDNKNYEEERLYELIKKFKIDCLFVHFMNVGVYLKNLINSLNIPTYIHCHGADITWEISTHQNPDNKIYDAEYIRSILNFSENVTFITNSNFTKKKLLAIGIDSSKVFVKYLGVPVPTKVPDKDDNGETQNTILYLGRLVDCKGPDLVIKAFELACSKGLDATLIIAGDGPLKITCDLLSRRSLYANKIKVIGAVDAKRGEELRANADIFTAHNCLGPLSHQEEAFGVSIIEAMAAGIPVVSASSGALSETVINNKTGVLVDPGDVEAHAQAFINILANKELALSMGREGWRRVMENFTFDQEKRNLVKILQLN